MSVPSKDDWRWLLIILKWPGPLALWIASKLHNISSFPCSGVLDVHSFMMLKQLRLNMFTHSVFAPRAVYGVRLRGRRRSNIKASRDCSSWYLIWFLDQQTCTMSQMVGIMPPKNLPFSRYLSWIVPRWPVFIQRACTYCTKLGLPLTFLCRGKATKCVAVATTEMAATSYKLWARQRFRFIFGPSVEFSYNSLVLVVVMDGLSSSW